MPGSSSCWIPCSTVLYVRRITIVYSDQMLMIESVSLDDVPPTAQFQGVPDADGVGHRPTAPGQTPSGHSTPSVRWLAVVRTRLVGRIGSGLLVPPSYVMRQQKSSVTTIIVPHVVSQKKIRVSADMRTDGRYSLLLNV